MTLLALAVLLLGLVPYPEAFVMAMRQAEAHRADGEYEAALDACHRAAQVDPGAPRPWLRSGGIYLLQNRFEEATEAFRQLEMLGGGSVALLGMGESMAGRGDWAGAMQSWLRAQAADPDDARIYVALGRGSIAQGHFDQARAYLSQALGLEPDPELAATAHALLGRLLATDDPAQSADHLRQAGDEEMQAVLVAANGEPDPARCALFLGAALLQREEIELARQYLERAVILDPANAEAHAYLGHTLDQQGETVAAREELDRALALDPDSALAYYFLGLHHRQVGNMEDAQAALWQALLRDPENAALRVQMAECFVDLSDYESAEAWYQGAVEVAPGDIEFHLMLVRFYLEHLYRVEEDGVLAAEMAADLAPGDARTQDLLGWAYSLTGDWIAGERALVRALELDPGLVSAHFHLGSLYAATSRYELARHYLERAADLDKTGYYRRRASMLLMDLP